MMAALQQRCWLRCVHWDSDHSSPPLLLLPLPVTVLLTQALLAALVNKLGDPSRKLASDAAFLLGQLLLQHPAMKAVVVREVRPQQQQQQRFEEASLWSLFVCKQPRPQVQAM